MKKKFVFVLGKILTSLREKAGLDQGQLGDKIDVSRQTINTWEGKATIKLTSDKAEQLAKALNVTIDVLTSDKTYDYTGFKHQIFEGDYIGMHKRAWHLFEETLRKDQDLLKDLATTIKNLTQAGGRRD